MSKLEELVVEQNKATDKYEETKNKHHIQAARKCIDDRRKILKEKLKKIKLNDVAYTSD